ncbi:amino acid adenylation domain-containing protein [Streptomyces sp. TRM 70351]|uniref:amino acid adenylation domain-containing protein n=1 Tax=Streptomyces sp. TRM 70351 TaxID=3116552 RepID=UPI002E7B0411|nr:amino acid adenylation domain-containing protein [Streptomyces sp. TRM 70351]MEE1931499.1 amino acid adenylation domain-containing protein [Streptomyces sp. TRM 70351]
METQQPSRHIRAARPAAACLPDLLRRQADVRPDALAVTSGDRGLTFRELVRAGSRLATRLHQRGVGVDDTVGLYVEPSLELMAGAWGVLTAGAAYLPLSPEYPEDRLRYMIEDSGTRVIVTQEHLAARLAELAPPGTRLVTLSEAGTGTGADAEPRTDTPIGAGTGPATGADADAAPGDAAGAGPGRAPEPLPDSLAYVIYTSGSTGKPKGVMIEHRSVLSQMRWLHACGHLGEHATVLQKTPMSFDAAQWEILAPAVGARVVMGAPGVYRDPERLIETIAKHEVTTLQCVPTLLQALLDTDEFHLCGSLRQVFSGGEALSRHLARAFTEQLPWASLVNLYGPTETTINATACLVDPQALGDGTGSVSIGVPVDNTQCYILDTDMSPVGIGETGELYIGGVQLARGYLGRPEQTRERFVRSPFVPTERLYRTGDLAYWNPDGTIQFAGRADNQVKLRGYRVELEEIALAVEEHTWVRRAAALVTDDTRTGFQNLVACVELNPKEAALMDQGSHGRHHQSKTNKLQVRAQLSNPGLRDADELRGRPVVELPGREATAHQRREVFARKTYRFFEGGDVTRDDLRTLLTPRAPRPPADGAGPLTHAALGEVLRWFGQFHSGERLLPKYAYASPGALYATQLYLESDGSTAGLAAGVYYYHPGDHTLVRVGPGAPDPRPGLSVHFLGRTRAIEPVYKTNIREVLEFEAGHMAGVFQEVLPEHGHMLAPLGLDPSVPGRLDVHPEDHYLGTFLIRPHDGTAPQDPTEIYVQAHPGRIADLPAGQYRHRDGELEHISDELVQARDVIAINQQVYERAAFGITAVSRAAEPWLEYLSLGTKLHHLQRNGLGLGFMSSGYSSKSGRPLPAARRMDAVLGACGIEPGPSYFFLGGRVSEEQVRSEGMREDAVHMKGPAEMIRDELARTLPDYMLPNRVLILDALPLTANGKVDCTTLAASDDVRSAGATSPYVAPGTPVEKWLAQAWGKALRYEDVSVEDEFFASGGNSLTAVALVNRVNREFGTQLPLQVLFESPRLRDLAARIESGGAQPSSRLVLLNGEREGTPVFCWPGLGGYPMNLRTLGREAGAGRPFYGVQAHGINAGEVPHPTIRDMAAADVAEIRRVQPEGPYTLWGYSFGARVAFETAWQLEQSGQQVADLLLICPGNPKVRGADADRHGREASYANPAYLTILFSVFAGAVSGPDLERCLGQVRDEDGFVSFVHGLYPALGEAVIRRITRIVGETYEFEYSFRELAERRLDAPVTILKATGDDYAFIEGSSGFSATPPSVAVLEGDHYGVLREPGVAELVAAIRNRPAA